MRVHGAHRFSCTLALTLSDMVAAEQKLSGEVAFFDVVVVGDGQQTFFAASDAHHGEIFQNFAADCTCADHKNLCVAKKQLHVAPQ